MVLNLIMKKQLLANGTKLHLKKLANGVKIKIHKLNCAVLTPIAFFSFASCASGCLCQGVFVRNLCRMVCVTFQHTLSTIVCDKYAKTKIFIDKYGGVNKHWQIQ